MTDEYSWRQAQEDRGRQLNAFASSAVAAPTPSELLTAAADRVRDLAAQATPGSWETIGDSGGIWREASPERAVRNAPGYLGGMNAAEDARWIAALSPAVAPHLEAILRRAASDIVTFVAAWKSTPRAPGAVDRLIEQQFGGELGLARDLVGEDQP